MIQSNLKKYKKNKLINSNKCFKKLQNKEEKYKMLNYNFLMRSCKKQIIRNNNCKNNYNKKMRLIEINFK